MKMVADMNMTSPSPRALLIAQEISFAKVLAGNDKVTRDRAVKKLRKWLSAIGPKQEFSEDDFLRIWKGLFYCMWMSDKFLVQEELAENLARLVHCFEKEPEKGFIFIKCFFKTMCVEWVGIDQYRVDKFLMLIRRFFRQSLKFIKNLDWKTEEINTILKETFLGHSAPTGLTLHFIEIFPEELAKVAKTNITGFTIAELLHPILDLAINTKDGRIRDQVGLLFKYLIKQSDVGIKYEQKFEAWKSIGFPGGDINLMKTIRKKKKKAKYDEDGEMVEEEEEVLDPRAGHVDVALPQIPIDSPAVIKVLETYQLNAAKTAKTKRFLAAIIKNFREVEKGRYPFAMKKLEVDEKIGKETKITKAAKRLMKFEQRLIDSKPKKKKKTKVAENEDFENEEVGEGELEGTDEDSDSVQDDSESEIPVLENGSPVSEPNEGIKNNKIDSDIVNKNSKTVNNTKLNENLKKSLGSSNTTPQRKIKIKDSRNSQDTFLDKCKAEENKNILTNQKEISLTPIKAEKRKSLLESFDVEDITDNEMPHKKQKLENEWKIETLDVKSPEYKSIIRPKIIKIEKKVAVDPWKEPLKEGEVEIFIPWKKKNTDQPATNIPAFFQKAHEKAVGRRISTPIRKLEEKPHTPVQKPGRRISFALNRNIEQEHVEYLEEVKKSPSIPFDSAKKPIQSALKAGLLPSPINPFYKLTKNPNFIKI